MGPKGGALPSVRLRLRLRKPSRSTDRGHAKAARMQAQETLSMGRAGLTSADARTPAKRGRTKARAEARTGRSPDVGRETFQMRDGKPQAGALPHGGEAARMQAQETLSMGRLTSADARTLAKRGRTKARAEARTGRSRMPGRETMPPIQGIRVW